MCGRYSQSETLSKLVKRFELKGPLPEDLQPRYNIAPSQLAPVVVLQEEPRLELFQWGLIPAWMKDPWMGPRMINARAETLTTKRSYSRPFKRSRCLVPADGFYEWKTQPGGKIKTPMRIRLRSQELFAFAGLWDSWRDDYGKELRSFTIITTDANETVSPIHLRMPAILKPEDEAAWLDPTTGAEQLSAMLGPYANDELEAYEISKLVNSPQNDSPDCFNPV